jgi:RNase P subunit RPR2
MPAPSKVFCPHCKIWWWYSWDRKVNVSDIARPTKAMRLTCNKCYDSIKFQASDGDDRGLSKADRMDDDE